MTKKEFNIKNVTVEEVVKHLKEAHQVPFDSRASLSVGEFISEHFPNLIKSQEDCTYGRDNNLGKQARERIEQADNILSKALKYCEENGMSIAKVYDFNEDGEAEWRICEPNEEQIRYLRFHRWFSSAEGYINKALLQQRMISEPEIDEMLAEFKEKVLEVQSYRERKRKKLLEVDNGNQTS